RRMVGRHCAGHTHGLGVKRPEILFHFSEDPLVTRFSPHVAATAATDDAFVWAIDAEHLDLYFFPRDCPRVTFHASPTTSAADRERCLGFTTARRVAAVEAGWLDRIRETRMYRYLLPAATFAVRDANAGYWVSRESVTPSAVEPVGDLLTALATADVEIRVL